MSNARLPFKREYNFLGLFQLFTVCAFPIHVWAMLMAFRDISWVVQRTQMSDGIGLVAYTLLFALLETAAIFLLLMVFDFLLPSSWKIDKRAALLGTLFLIASLWAMIGQLYFILGVQPGKPILALLGWSGHPLFMILVLLLPLVILSVAIPTAAILRSKKFLTVVIDAFDRIMILSSVYLLLDLVGIIIVIARNV